MPVRAAASMGAGRFAVGWITNGWVLDRSSIGTRWLGGGSGVGGGFEEVSLAP
jgi:hypothetical protein